MNGHRDYTPRPKPITLKKEKKPLSKVRKATGELDIFKEIIRERQIGGKTYSQISAELIENPNHFNCHHILPKGQYGLFRDRKDNIVLITEDEHFDIHNNLDMCKKDPRWKWYFDKAEELKIEYNQKDKAA